MQDRSSRIAAQFNRRLTIIGSNDRSAVGYQMNLRFRRGLLPVLCAMIALILSVHQAGALEHEHCVGVETVARADAHDPKDTEYGAHPIACCAIAVGMAISHSDAEFFGLLRSRFAAEAADLLLYPHLRSKHFRPPRHS
jgi:hypothetical protein